MTFFAALAEEPYDGDKVDGDKVDGDKVDGDKVEVPQEVHVTLWSLCMYVCTYICIKSRLYA